MLSKDATGEKGRGPHLLDELDSSHEHVVRGQRLNHVVREQGLGLHIRIVWSKKRGGEKTRRCGGRVCGRVDGWMGGWMDTEELGTSPEEGEELEVVKTPDTVAAGGFHQIGPLESPHEIEVAGEDVEDEVGEVVLVDGADEVEAAHPGEERHLVSGAVVDAGRVAHPFHQIAPDLPGGGLVTGERGGSEDLVHEAGHVPLEPLKPSSERLVPEALGLLLRGDLPDPHTHLVEDSEGGEDGVGRDRGRGGVAECGEGEARGRGVEDGVVQHLYPVHEGGRRLAGEPLPLHLTPLLDSLLRK